MKIREQNFPPGSVVVRVPRSEFPAPLNATGEYHQEYPFVGVEEYSLVIVPSGVVRSRIKDATDLLSYGYLWSGKSGKLYEWGDYYSGELRRTTDVGGEKVFVECLPDKRNYHNPPKAVNLYASTAGVVWLALRSLGEWAIYSTFVTHMTELDDAPFGTYFDKLDEAGITEPPREEIRTKLNLYFGLGG